MKKLATLTLCTVLTSILAGCGGADDTLDADVRKTPSICPQAILVPPAREIRNYGKRANEPNNIVVQARMDSLRGTCEAATDDGKASVELDLTLAMVAQRGPRYEDQDVAFPYYIAVADAQDHVVTRQNLIAHFDMADARTARDEERLHVTLPLPADAHGSAAAYRVLAGFRFIDKR